jgi:hypothetical protein
VLTEAQVVEIRRRAYENAEMPSELAAAFGTNRHVINDILDGKTFGGLPGPIVKSPYRWCLVCGESIAHRKRSALTCGGRCRETLRRERARAAA